MASELKRLVYISTGVAHFDDAALQDLLHTSRSNNKQRGIGGMLLYRNGKFIQVLEGPPHAVENTFLTIRRDKRHTDVAIVLEEEVDSREFADWAMAFNGDARDEIEGLSDFLKGADSQDEQKLNDGKIKRLLKRFRVVNRDKPDADGNTV